VLVVAFYIKPHVSKHLQADNTKPLLLSQIRKLLKTSKEHKVAADIEQSLEHSGHSVKQPQQFLLDSAQCQFIEKISSMLVNINASNITVQQQSPSWE
jgi:hypothetical protein